MMKAVKLYKSSGLFQIFGKRPQIIINQSGIWDRTSQRRIDWNSIEYAEINNQSERFIRLRVKGKSGLVEEVKVSLARIKVDTAKLERFINDMMSAKEEDRATKVKGVTEPGTEV